MSSSPRRKSPTGTGTSKGNRKRTTFKKSPIIHRISNEKKQKKKDWDDVSKTVAATLAADKRLHAATRQCLDRILVHHNVWDYDDISEDLPYTTQETLTLCLDLYNSKRKPTPTQEAKINKYLDELELKR